MSEAPDNLKRALGCAARGWPVFPCKPDKSPYTAHGFKDASADEATIRTWWQRHPDALVGIDTDGADLAVLDVDVKNDAPGVENLAKIVKDLGDEILDTTTTNTPSGGFHLYYRRNGRHIGSSAGKLAAGIDVRAERGYVIAYDFESGPERLCDLPDSLAARLALKEERERQQEASDGDAIPKGRRNATLASLAGTMRHRGMGEEAIAAALLAENNGRCQPPLSEAEVRVIAQSVAGYAPGATESIGEPRWPAPLGEAAYHGPIGALVKAWEPNTEADPAAMLVTLLAGFGSICGAGPYHAVRKGRHPARLFVLIVGNTSSGKGQSAEDPIDALRQVDPEWYEHCQGNGLSTGEGLIHRVRNPTWRKDRRDRTHCEDAGVEDKRLFVVEGELARMLAAMVREGNTLSQVIRALYDSGTVGTMTKQPYSTTGAHVTLIGQITPEELQRKLSDTDAASGFANRFLIVCAERQRSLPIPPDEDETLLRPHIHALQEAAGAIQAGDFDGPVPWDKDAVPLWVEVYDGLMSDEPGMVGKILARGRPQVARIALTFALADGSHTIKRVHLEAALEVWRYCSDSVRHLFAGRAGNSDAERLLRALQDGPMTRSAIRELYGNHRKAWQLDAILKQLAAAGRIERVPSDPTGGRPVEVWRRCER